MRKLADKHEHIVYLISRTIPMTKVLLQQAWDAGMIRKADLKNGQYYLGRCRNANVARWDTENNCFWHIRHKFGNAFVEGINHPEDARGYDVFTPFETVDPTDEEKVIEEEIAEIVRNAEECKIKYPERVKEQEELAKKYEIK